MIQINLKVTLRDTKGEAVDGLSLSTVQLLKEILEDHIVDLKINDPRYFKKRDLVLPKIHFDITKSYLVE